ncbi:unnamed protein product [Larinioides sclopetarius]|uniref:Uncharacterized protein n=1 Tax=Larinioides sclopetarius TaxID=280406 RepID=A0AAV2BDW8_9ARAC
MKSHFLVIYAIKNFLRRVI